MPAVNLRTHGSSLKFKFGAMVFTTLIVRVANLRLRGKEARSRGPGIAVVACMFQNGRLQNV